MKKIQFVIIATYEDLFKKPSAPALEKIKKYPLQVVMAELVGVNYMLRPATKLSIKSNLFSQLRMIAFWIGYGKYLSNLYTAIRDTKAFQLGNDVIIFNRAGCLYGIDYSIRNLKSNDEEFKYTDEFWTDLIDFCLACNTVVTKHEIVPEDYKVSLMEHINAQQALLNELKIVSNPILTLNRCIELFRWFERDNIYHKEFSAYLESLELDSEKFLEILLLLYLNPKAKSRIPFWINLDEKNSPEASALLKWLSDAKLLEKKHDLDFLMLYKWPVYKYKAENYFMLDPELMIDKMYRQLINDFYWDHLRAKGISYQNYRSFIGKFFEKYVAGHFKDYMSSNKPATFKHTYQLLFGHSERELCDIYIRHKRNVMVGQVKSTAFSDDQKFKTSYEFYKGDTKKFYDDAGVNQIIQSIVWLEQHGGKIDSPFYRNTKLFPVLILNDKFFEIPMMTQILNEEFRKQLQSIKSNFVVKDLVVMSVSSVERLHAKNINNRKDLWKLLWSTQLHSGILPHFNNTLDRFNVQFNPKRELKKVKTFLHLKKNNLSSVS